MSRDLTYESSFMRLNTKRAETLHGYFLQSLYHCRYFQTFISLHSPTAPISLNFLPGPVKIMASVKNGLLLCLGEDYPQEADLFVCKPTTRQWIRISNPNQRFSGVGSFGMVVLGYEPLWFKVVRVLERRLSNREFDGFNWFNLQLFDSDTIRWKHLGTMKLPFCEYLRPGRPSLESSMALHWLTNESKLFTFYGDKETWEITSLPSNLSDTRLLDPVETEGRLRIIESFWQKNYVNLWIMEGKIWKKMRTVEMVGVKEHHGSFFTRAFYGSDMATLSSLNRLIFQNLNNKKNEVVKTGGHLHPDMFFFQSNFELVCFEGMQKRRKKKKKQDMCEEIDAWDMFYTYGD